MFTFLWTPFQDYSLTNIKLVKLLKKKKIENKFTNSFRENLYKKRIDLFLGKREKVEENHFQ